jgi:hypothetical protein
MGGRAREVKREIVQTMGEMRQRIKDSDSADERQDYMTIWYEYKAFLKDLVYIWKGVR